MFQLSAFWTVRVVVSGPEAFAREARSGSACQQVGARKSKTLELVLRVTWAVHVRLS